VGGGDGGAAAARGRGLAVRRAGSVTVLHVARDLPPSISGGMSIATAAMVRAEGGDVAVVSFDAWRPRARSGPSALTEDVTPEGAPVLRIGGPYQLEAARAWARRLAPTGLVVHDGMLWAFARELRDELGVPATLVVHVAHRALNAARGLEGLTTSLSCQEEALATADTIVVPTAAAADLLGPELAGDPRIRVEPPPLELTPLPRAPGAADGPALYVGRFDVAKGTDVLQRAWPAVRRAWSDARLVVAGGLPKSPKGERRWLADWDRLPGVEVVGWLDRAAVAAAYAEASVLVVPSRVETFGLAAAEGSAAGVPIVASDLATLREVVGDDGATWVPPGDAAALASAIVAALAEPRVAG